MPDRFQTATPRPEAGERRVRTERVDDGSLRGTGWVLFAGVMISIVGVLNVIYGIAAISDSRFYVRDTQYVLSDLNTYGWVLLIIGAVQLCAGVGIWVGAEWARWAGILTAGVNAIVHLLFMPSYPLLALALFAIDVIVIYGLVAYGGRQWARP